MAKLSLSSSIEPLEARIAPALLVYGANLLGGANGPKTGETSMGDNAVTLVKVVSGQALVWFDGDHVSAISFGPNTTLDLTGDVGDLVGNLLPNGRLSDGDNDVANGDDGNLLLNNNLLGLTTHPLSEETGSVGRIITGGTVTKVNVAGEFNGIYAGDGAFHPEANVFDGTVAHATAGVRVNPVDVSSSEVFTFTRAQATMAPSASISYITVGIAEGMEIIAGSGNPKAGAPGGGLKGGSISNVKISSAILASGAGAENTSYALYAGDGANGLIGGVGGSISFVTEETSNGLVKLIGGRGGNAIAASGGAAINGAGGAGGNIQDVDLQGDSASYEVTGGAGGSGKTGGKGGGVFRGNFAGKQPNTGIVVAADFTNDGLDDVLVVDTSSGSMVVSKANLDGTFSDIPQYLPVDGIDSLIEAAGSTPSDAVAVDVNGDDLLDIVVSYKNSNNVGIYLNEGLGNFYGTGTGGVLLAKPAEAPATSLAVAGSPIKLALGDFSGDSATDVAVLSAVGKKSTVSFLSGSTAGGLTSDYTVTVSSDPTDIVTATDFVTLVRPGGDALIVASKQGELFSLIPGGSPTKSKIAKSDLVFNGGVRDLAIDSTSETLIAVGTGGRALHVYAVNEMVISLLGDVDYDAQPGQTVKAVFIDKADGEDELALLTVAGSTANLGYYVPHTGDDDPGTIDATYDFVRQVSTLTTLKNFSIAYHRDLGSNGEPGDITGFSAVALGSSLNQFTYSPEINEVTNFPLPFKGKEVAISGGAGGLGLLASAGGAGGAITGISIDSAGIALGGGAGGDSQSGPGGAGGSIGNTGSFTTPSGQPIVPLLSGSSSIVILGGHGGSPLATGGKTANGGFGGSVSGLNVTLGDGFPGDFEVTAGNGGTARGGLGGKGGDASKLVLKSLGGGGLALRTGNGGDALSGNMPAGAGGAINDVSFTLELNDSMEKVEQGYVIGLATGNGGKSTAGQGGAGGAINGATVKADLPDGDEIAGFQPSAAFSATKVDSTVRVSFQTGDGGEGINGGAGGNLNKASYTSYFDEIAEGFIVLNPAVLSMVGGDGGKGTAGNGGAGGNINLSSSAAIQGVTDFDRDAPESHGAVLEADAQPELRVNFPLLVAGGEGGEGTVRGGAGGAVAGLKVQNARLRDADFITNTQVIAAAVSGGKGGLGGSSAGGKGGDVSAVQLAVFGSITGQGGALADGRPLLVAGGEGGAGATGGAGGSVLGSVLGANVTDLFVLGGDAGQGVTLGGKGGALAGLSLEVPALFGLKTKLFGGDGGAATGANGAGGEGGGISGISQLKNVNSAIALIQAGNGGTAALGVGGKGGNASNIKTGGFLGQPVGGSGRLGVFDEFGDVQGLYSGRGGLGKDAASAGASGSVSDIVARQIAAIAAAIDPATKTFAFANSVSNIRADVIGFDKDAPGSAGYGLFDSTVGGHTTPASPAVATPIDGFILSKTKSLNVIAKIVLKEFNA